MSKFYNIVILYTFLVPGSKVALVFTFNSNETFFFFFLLAGKMLNKYLWWLQNPTKEISKAIIMIKLQL